MSLFIVLQGDDVIERFDWKDEDAPRLFGEWLEKQSSLDLFLLVKKIYSGRLNVSPRATVE